MQSKVRTFTILRFLVKFMNFYKNIWLDRVRLELLTGGKGENETSKTGINLSH